MADYHQGDLLKLLRPRRRHLLLFLSAAAALWLADRWMTEDPEPYFQARHGELAQVETQRTETRGSHFLEHFRLVSTSGLSVELSLLRPAEYPTALPAILLLGGHRTGRNAVELVPPDPGVVVAAISYPYAGPTKLKGLQVFGALPTIRKALLDTPPALSLALDYLTSLPSVDPRRLELVGVSLGAPLACVAGAVDDRPSRVWSIHGGGSLGRMLEHNLAREVPSRWLRWPLARFGAWLLSPLEPESFAPRISPRPLVLLNARHDERIPPESVDSLFRAAREPKEMVWLDGGHVGTRREEVIRELVERVLTRIGGREVPLHDGIREP